jgi:diguanylate cyclase (GGDEF)-like protein
MDYPFLVNTGKCCDMQRKKKSKTAVPAGSARARSGSAKAVAKPVAKARKGATKPTLAIARTADPKLEIRRLKARLSAALAQIDALRASADTDFLLDILNRRGFSRELNRSSAYIKRYHANAAVIMLDIDRLKPVNDRFGHAAGDAVLKAVVEVLLRHVRASDVLGRLGGDEFALLLWNLDEAAARTKAATLEAAVDQLRFDFDGHPAAVGISAGVAILCPETDPSDALARADVEMYARKAERKRVKPKLMSADQ